MIGEKGAEMILEDFKVSRGRSRYWVRRARPHGVCNREIGPQGTV